MIEISTEYAEVKPGVPLNVKASVNGDEFASRGVRQLHLPLDTDCLDDPKLPPGLASPATEDDTGVTD